MLERVTYAVFENNSFQFFSSEYSERIDRNRFRLVRLSQAQRKKVLSLTDSAGNVNASAKLTAEGCRIFSN